jgi:hypothetical protein
MLGLHQVPARGVRYQVRAEVSATLPPGWLPELTPAPPVPGERPARRSLPARPGHRWLAGDLHSHTLHSDGALTVPELTAFAVRQGLDFLAVTDHNTVSHHAELPAASRQYGITLVPGQEVTTAFGHANVFGEIGWIDFRGSADSWLDASERSGGLMAVNHPIAGPVAWLHSMRRRPPLVEVWHWSWLDLSWTIPLSWWQAWDPVAIPVGGSDWHREGSDAPPGQPTTWVEVADSACDEPTAILDAVRAGRVAISATRDGPVLLRSACDADADLIAVGASGLTLAGPEGGYLRVSGDLATLPGKPGYHRLLDSRGGTRALTPLAGRARVPAGGDRGLYCQQVQACVEQGAVGDQVVALVRVRRGFARADRAREPTVRLGGAEPLEHHERIGIRRHERLVQQPGGVADPGVLDLAPAPVVDQHRQGVLLVAVGEARRH